MSQPNRLARRYVRLSTKHPLLILLAFTIATAFATIGTVKVFGNVRTNVRDLLPEDTPSRSALELSDVRRGSSDLYVIAIESPDAYANIEMVEALRLRIEAEWDEAQWVQYDEDATFFREHALLYLPEERLLRFRDELRIALRCELQRVNPVYVELSDACDGDSDVEWTMDYWIGDDLTRELGLPEEFFGSWDEELSSSNEDTEGENAEAPTVSSEGSVAQGEEGAEPPPLVVPDDLGHYLIGVDDERRMFISALYVQLTKPSTDVEFANEMQQRGVALIADLDPQRFHPEMRAEIKGAYQSLNEAREAVSDSMKALVVSLFFVVGIMLGFFRAIRGLVIVVVPLAMGITWTMGLSYLTYGQLNLYTMFVGSVLIGMGIDFGIHLYGRALEAFRRGKSWEDALEESLQHTGPALLAAAATTIGALLTLLVSHFKGFQEFGVIASYGVVFCMASAYLVMPPLILTFERVLPLKRKDSGPVGAGKAGSSPRVWYTALALVVALIGGSVAVSSGAEFEYDFRNLRGASSHGGIRYGKAVGRGKATSSAVILGADRAQMLEVHQMLRERFAANDPMLKGFITIETYVPDDQPARMAIIREPADEDDPFNRQRRNDIASIVERSALDRLEGDVADFVGVIRDLVEVEPFELDAIPPWAYRTIQEADGSVGGIGIMFRSIQSWNAVECMAFQDEFGTLSVPSGEVPVADAAFITADVVRTVQADGKRMGLLVAGFLLLVLLVSLRSLRGAIICMLTLGGAMALTIGGMVVTGTRVGMYNMIVLPAILGVGIDGAIHLYHRFNEMGRDRLGEVMRTTGLAVVAASLTTAGGFAGLLFQGHLGIRSIGELAVIGILAAMLSVFLLMPALLLLSGQGRTAGTEE